MILEISVAGDETDFKRVVQNTPYSLKQMALLDLEG